MTTNQAASVVHSAVQQVRSGELTPAQFRALMRSTRSRFTEAEWEAAKFAAASQDQ